MADATDQIIVFVTASSEEEAVTIGRKLVEGELVACANVIPRIRSVFRWEGKVAEEQEALLILKSRMELFDQLEKAVKSLHSYSVPEIIAVPLAKGAGNYLDWISEMTGKPKKN
ncbi:MAG: divalent-cation tolerance protein CutA [Nitrospirota bacterium]|jgi:periplasmic divalent cation tolerance protein